MDKRLTFARDYVDNLKRVLTALPLEPLTRVMAILETAYQEQRHVFIAGNGGSAATASHMASDLLWGIAQTGRRGFRVSALTDNVPSMTAIANDSAFAEIFVAPLAAQARVDDVFIAISASGNSPNILRGIEQARRMGLSTIAFLGKGGGAAATLVDTAVVVPSDQYEPVEDVHMMFDHLLIAYLRQWVLDHP